MTSVSLSAEAHHHCRAGLPAQARHGRPARCLVQHRGHLVSLHGKGRNLAEEISRKFAGVGHEIKTKEMKEISIRWAGNLDLPQGSERLGGGRDTAAHAHSPLVAVRLHRGHAYLCCGGNVALALCGAEDVAENGDKYYFDSTHTSIYNCFELVWGDPAVDARRVEGDWRRAGLPKEKHNIINNNKLKFGAEVD